MKGFYLYPVKNGGRAYWMVEYGEKIGRGKWKRRQNMFADRGRAEEFLERVKREVLSKGRIEFGTDRALHGDAMRAAAMVRENGLPSGSLTTAMWVLLQCRSAREYQGGRYEVVADRKVELNPRTFLGVTNVAREMGCSLKDVVEGAIWEMIERRVCGRMKEKEQEERAERQAFEKERARRYRLESEAREEERMIRKFNAAFRAA